MELLLLLCLFFIDALVLRQVRLLLWNLIPCISFFEKTTSRAIVIYKILYASKWMQINRIYNIIV